MNKVFKKYYLFRIKRLMNRLLELEKSPFDVIQEPQAETLQKAVLNPSRREQMQRIRTLLALYNYKTKIVS